MITLLVLLLPLMVAMGVYYLLITMGDAVVTVVEDWVSDHLRGNRGGSDD